MSIAVLSSVVMVSAASAQTYVPHFPEDTVEIDESSRTVVLTIKKLGPGHVHYETADGSCRRSDRFALDPPTNCEPAARAPGDYGAVSGDLIFTEAGSKTITIPIVDDGLDEGREGFTVDAYEGDSSAGWTGSSALVWIMDDDSADGGAAALTTTTALDGGAGAGPAPPAPPAGDTAGGEPPAPTPTTSSSSDLQATLASDELRPGPGFELVIGASPEPARPLQEASDRANSGLAFGLLIAVGAVTMGGIVWVVRRRRWSPTRP